MSDDERDILGGMAIVAYVICAIWLLALGGLLYLVTR